MKPSKKTIQVVILLGVLLIGGYAIGKTLFADDSKTPRVGKQPPAFTLAGLDGKTYSLSDYKGKAVVVTFWGTFCPPCVKEMPEFERQYNKWRDKPFEILAINLSEPDLPVTNFVRQHKLTFPILRDVKRHTEREYGLRSYPTTFFIKPDGTIMEIVVNPMTEQQIEERVERLLATL